MENLFNDRYYKLGKCHEVIKNTATVLHIIADGAFWLGLIGSVVWAITEAINSESVGTFFSVFGPAILTTAISYLASIWACHLIFSWGEKIEHTKKQTELLKIMAIEKNKNSEQ